MLVAATASLLLHLCALITIHPLLSLRLATPPQRPLQAWLAKPAEAVGRRPAAAIDRAPATVAVSPQLAAAGEWVASRAATARREASLSRNHRSPAGADQPAPATPTAEVSAQHPHRPAPREPLTDNAVLRESAPAGETLPPLPADDLRQYRFDLALAARRFKVYPAAAIAQQAQGEVVVELTLSAVHPVPQVSIARSSGHPELDQQAQRMLDRAAAATSVPPTLRGIDFRIVLPIAFLLDDAR